MQMLDNIYAAFQLEADLRGKELLGCYASASQEDLSLHSGHRKRKAPSSPMSSYPDNHTLQTAKQVPYFTEIPTFLQPCMYK